MCNLIVHAIISQEQLFHKIEFNKQNSLVSIHEISGLIFNIPQIWQILTEFKFRSLQTSALILSQRLVLIRG